jgi:hypothetical protein
VQRSTFGILEAVRERLARHRRAAEPRVVGRDRAIGIDADDATREVAAHVGLVRRRVLGAVEIGIVEPKRVGARYIHRAVAREYDAPLDAAFDQRLDTEDLAVVEAQLRARDALCAEVEQTALGERLVPDLVVVVLDRPLARGLALRRREVREVDVAVCGEARVEHDVVEALRRDDFDGRHACDGL